MQGWPEFRHLAEWNTMFEAVAQEKAQKGTQTWRHTPRQRLRADHKMRQYQAPISAHLSLDICDAPNLPPVAGLQLRIQNVPDRKDLVMRIYHWLASDGNDFKWQ